MSRELKQMSPVAQRILSKLAEKDSELNNQLIEMVFTSTLMSLHLSVTEMAIVVAIADLVRGIEKAEGFFVVLGRDTEGVVLGKVPASDDHAKAILEDLRIHDPGDTKEPVQ